MHIRAKIESFDHQGRGIAKINGKVIFIPNALPNEEVEFIITQEKKHYSIGQVKKILISSSVRNNCKCPYFFECGGCHISHLKYEKQLNFKQDSLTNIIKKYANLDIKSELVFSEKKLEYRNKVSLKIVNRKWGYYKEETHDFVPIQRCLLAKESINRLLNDKDLFDIKNGEIIIKSSYQDELLISIKTNNKINIKTEIIIKKHNIKGIIFNDKLLYGKDFFIEKIGNFSYQVGINNFFQVNLDVLYKVFEILNQKEYKKVLDLYCGVGTLGIAIKKEKLYGIEIVESSIKNALINSESNNQNNIYIVGDSSKIKEIKDNINTIIIDPPRSGISKETISFILEKKIDEIIYMSCNPMTLARDLNLLKESYIIEKAYLLDMFPQTYHIESLFVITRKGEK